MRRPTTIHRHVLGVLALSCVAASWSGCAEEDTTSGTTSSGTGGSNTTGMGGTGAGGDDFNAGGAGVGGGAVCVATSEKAEATPLDIVFMLDWSQSMQGSSWTGTKNALQTFFEDPLSTGISAGMVFSPTIKPFGETGPCDINHYKELDVPVAPLPGNAFALTNSMPENAVGSPTPLAAALPGALLAATARQDAYPSHKVIVVMTGDGGHNTCEDNISEIAAWARDAREYNGVRTYVISVESSAYYPENLELIAEEGGTAVYDAQDIGDFSDKMAEIRAAALGCDFEIPPPPEGEGFVLDKVNFTYTPGGSDTPITLPHADNLDDCGEEPGWYYDSNVSPTKIIVCPASCNTIQNDTLAEVAVAFGCTTVAN